MAVNFKGLMRSAKNTVMQFDPIEVKVREATSNDPVSHDLMTESNVLYYAILCACHCTVLCCYVHVREDSLHIRTLHC
jgi:hypothetical protein